MLGPPPESDYLAIRILVAIILIGGVTVTLGDVFWSALPLIGVTLTALGLILAVWLAFGRPWRRTRKLTKPCDVRFVIRERGRRHLPHFEQDDKRHIVDELVLPSQSVVEIEFGFKPKVPIYVQQIALGCEGDPDNKPFIVQVSDQFTEANVPKWWLPGEDGHSRDIYKHWHWVRNTRYSVGTHRVITLKVRTGGSGKYPFKVSFFTDEVEGKGQLKLIVEDEPKTRVRCRADGHWGCFIGPRSSLEP